MSFLSEATRHLLGLAKWKSMKLGGSQRGLDNLVKKKKKEEKEEREVKGFFYDPMKLIVVRDPSFLRSKV